MQGDFLPLLACALSQLHLNFQHVFDMTISKQYGICKVPTKICLETKAFVFFLWMEEAVTDVVC